MTTYPSLNALRKKDAEHAVDTATANRPSGSPAANPLSVKKIKRRRSRRTALKVVFLSVALMLVAGSVFGARLLTVGNGNFGDTSDGFFAQLRALFGDSQALIGEDSDRVNVLLLGIGGPGHDGPNLSDTIVIASIKPSTKEVAILSLPRDLYINVPNFGFAKLNSAFAIGEESQYPGGGAALATETIESITGLDLPYYVVVDFKGFQKIVDDLGGIDLEIPEEFFDTLHQIQYDAGPAHFDGKGALYFVRARYGLPRGDFSRAEHTQLVMVAVRDKALKLNPVADLGTITSIVSNLGDHVRTNLQPSEMRRVYELIHDISVDAIQSRVVDDAETQLVYGDMAPIGGVNVSVLLPSDPTLGDIQIYAKGMFDPLPPEAENATLEIQNGSSTPGIAASFSEEVELGLEVLGVSNATRSDYDETFVVDNTDGDKPTSLESLLEKLREMGLEPRVLTRSTYANSSAADLIVVLGQDYAEDQEL
jgi:LCP family protein required for cell wall assembly